MGDLENGGSNQMLDLSTADDSGNEKRPLQLLLVGDCMLGRLVNEALLNTLPEYPWGDTLPIFRSADLRICNLECVISDRGEPWTAYPKAFHFRSSAKNIAVLKAAGMNAVSLANNHVLDYGYDALYQMLEILDRAGIAHSGAGTNLEEAACLAKICVRGKKVGLLAFTDNEPGWEATASRPGVFYVPTVLNDPRAQGLLKIVRSQWGSVDLLIVSAHWGSNWGYEPPREHIAFAHALIDAGADMIFGHSSHVFRGIELWKERLILYGAGNFVDDYAVDSRERNDQSFIYSVDTEGRTAQRVRLYPTMIRRCQARRATGIYERSIAVKMAELCGNLNTRTQWDRVRQCLEIATVTKSPQAA